MTNDFYCDEVLSGHTSVERVLETDTVLAFHHTKPAYPIHLIVIPKQHIPSLIDITKADSALMLEMLDVISQIAAQVTREQGACRVVMNLGSYQESKHLHWHIISGNPLR